MTPKDKKLLLVFDLNGTLVHRIKKPHEKRLFQSHPNQPLSLVHFPCRGSVCYVRPHARKVLKRLFLMKHVKVAVWTSAHMENAVAMSKWLFQNNFNSLEFILDRSTCDNAPMGLKSGSVVKSLDRIWGHSSYNPAKLWNETNTLIVDDSPHKLVETPENRIPIPEFSILNHKTNPTEDDHLLKLMNWVENAFEVEDDSFEIDLRAKLLSNNPFA